MEITNHGKMGKGMDRIILTAVFIVYLFSISSCIAPNNKIEHTITPTKNTVVITNNNNFPVTFHLKVNDLFPLDSVDILKLINEDTTTSDTDEKAWAFVRNNTFTSLPFSSDNWQHNPFVFLNSIGAGFCDDNASLLASIWRFQHKKSRIYGIEGHVIPEVFVQNKWQMYDAMSGVFYLNKNKEVCSVEELALDTNLFYTKGAFPNNVQPYNLASNRLFIPYYFSTTDNEDVSEWHLDYPKITNEFILPSYSSLHITIDSTTGSTSISVHLSEKSKGLLKIPLVPFSSFGNFDYRFDNKTTKVTSNYTFPSNDFYGTILIEQVHSQTEINYLVNPKLTCLKQFKNVKLRSSFPLKVSETNTINKPEILFSNFEYIVDKQTRKHIDLLNKLSEFSTNDITKEFILKHYLVYLKEEKIDQNKCSILVDKFSKQNDSFGNKESTWRLIKQYFPRSLIYLYVANTYNKYDELIPFLNSTK